MKGDVIPDPDHVARYCGASTVDEGKIQATAFMVRERDAYLSVNWLEALGRHERAAQVRDLRALYGKKLKVGAKARIAILNVGAVRSKVETESPDGRQLRVLHEPEPDDPSHSGVYGIPHDDDLAAELIAQVVLEDHPARA